MKPLYRCPGVTKQTSDHDHVLALVRGSFIYIERGSERRLSAQMVHDRRRRGRLDNLSSSMRFSRARGTASYLHNSVNLHLLTSKSQISIQAYGFFSFLFSFSLSSRQPSSLVIEYLRSSHSPSLAFPLLHFDTRK